MAEGLNYTVRVRYHVRPTPVALQGGGEVLLIPYADDPVTLWGGSPAQLTPEAEASYPESMLLTVRVDDLGEPIHIYTGGTTGFGKNYKYIGSLRPGEVRTFNLSHPLAAVVHEPAQADSLVYCHLHQSTYFVVNPPH